MRSPISQLSGLALVFLLSSGFQAKAAAPGDPQLESPSRHLAPTRAQLPTLSPAPNLTAIQLSDSVDHSEKTSKTYRRQVTVSFSYSGGGPPGQVMISESPSFTGASWLTYGENMSFTLSDQEGLHTVYARARTSATSHVSAVRQDSIHFARPPVISSVTLDNGASSTSVQGVRVRWQHQGTATQYRISNSPDMTGVSWQNGGSPPPLGVAHDLALGSAGTRTVHLQLRNGQGPAVAGSDSIQVSSPLCPIGHHGRPCSDAGTCLPSGQCQCNPDIEGPACETICQRCYGANGNNCGAADGLNFGFCVGNLCMINAGSWSHDECCVRHRWGGPGSQQGSCSPPPFGPNPRYCQVEFAKAAAHLHNPQLTWIRTVNTGKKMCTDGVIMRVDHADMCNPSGGTLLCSDVRYCCSRRGQEVSIQAPITTGGKLCRCE